MGGIEFTDNTLVVDRQPNDLDELALSFSSILSAHAVGHVFVAGYVAILAGRARSTQDIYVLLERTDEPTIEAIAEDLETQGYWGPAMPLSDMYEMLSNGDQIWIARDGEVAPHLEAKHVTDRFDRASLTGAISARIAGNPLPIGPLELQIAYKLYLGTDTDFEDAVHLYTLFEETLSTPALEQWVENLGVRTDYDRLVDA